MAARKKEKLATGKPQRKSIERDDAVQRVRARQSATPAPDDGAQSSANSPDNNLNEADYSG